MFSTSSKIAFGYLLLIVLLFGTIGYIYQQMTLLMAPNGLEETIVNRRRTTHQIVTQLYEAEIIGQTLRTGRLGDYPIYQRAMREAGASIDSLRVLLSDTLQQARLDTVSQLLRNKERYMILVLEAMAQNPAEELYQQQIDSLILQQDSLLSSTHVRRRIVTHHNTYTIHHKPKKFFRRLADVFAPGKEDSTQVNNVIQEEYTDTIDEAYNPVDTIASMLANIQNKVFQTRQENQKTLDRRINSLRIAGSRISQRVNQLLETIETDEQKAAEAKYLHEQNIREQAAWTMATISILAVLLVLIFFTIIWRDITRSNHYRRELEKAKSYAENLLVTREKLMLTITHDIKAPAGSIIGYIDLLTRLIHDKRQQFYLQNMKSSAQHLLDLITSLLDYHRLEAGKMDLNPVAFKPHQLFTTIYTSFLPLAERKQLKLVLENTIPASKTLEGDPFRLRQIVENLLSNALKFTAEGSVTLHTAYEGNQFIFSVSDTGCGMDEQEQQRVFQAFTRLRSAQGEEGFGLGLSITQKLVELLQGKISIESVPGKGSTFRVSVPLPSISNKKEVEKENGPVLPETLKIILIDDDSIQINLTEAMLHNLLEAQGKDQQAVIRCCKQPEELFGYLEKEPFDLLLTDIQMPAMNGFELLKQVRGMKVGYARELPVIAITARSDMDVEYFRSQGFAGCLHKPFNQSDLLQVLQKNLKGDWNKCTFPKEESADSSLPEARPAKEEKEESKFSSLIAFSEGDEEAIREIIGTFIQETEKNCQAIRQGEEAKDMKLVGNLAHKMLPTFTMIEANTVLPSLKWLEAHREDASMSSEALDHIHKILPTVKSIIEHAEAFIKNYN